MFGQAKKALLKFGGVCALNFAMTIMGGCSKENLPLRHSYFDRPSSEFIAVFGDIQYYTFEEDIHLFKNSLSWIEDNRNKMNTLCVLCTGDIKHTSNEQWKYFDEAMKDFFLPFISNIGNHDYDWKNGLLYDKHDTYFSEHTQFPLVTERIEAAFETGRMENIVIRNEIHGERYDILLLEYSPRKEVVEWAQRWVILHPEIKYILMTHRYLAKNGVGLAKGVPSSMRETDDYITPEELWTQLIKCNDNIAWVLCGHVGGLYGATYEKNDFGREVCQIEHNIQGSEYRYDNWLMIWEFPEDSDLATVSIVNTKTGYLYDSKEALFTFKYRY